MEKARAAVSSFLSQSGKHKTYVDEVQHPAFTQERVLPYRHEVATQAVDREIHQHHYHTSVQPLQHKEALPEKHVHNPQPVERRELRDEDTGARDVKVAADLGRFQDSRVTHDTTHSMQDQQAQIGEHTHHHIHETVQPVIYKELHQPEVVHVTQPVAEVHYAPSEHHGLSQMPTKTIDELKTHGIDVFKGSGGKIVQKQDYEGCPHPYNPKLQLERKPLDINPKEHDGLHDLDSTGHPPLLTKSTSGNNRTSTKGVEDEGYSSPPPKMAQPSTPVRRTYPAGLGADGATPQTAHGYHTGTHHESGPSLQTEAGKTAHGFSTGYYDERPSRLQNIQTPTRGEGQTSMDGRPDSGYGSPTTGQFKRDSPTMGNRYEDMPTNTTTTTTETRTEVRQGH